MGDVASGLLALSLGALISDGAVRAVIAEARKARHARTLRQRGKTTIAIIESLSRYDPEKPTLRAVVSFELGSGTRQKSIVDLHHEGRPGLAVGVAVEVRYDPADPQTAAAEAGRRQGHSQYREAVVVSALMIVLVLPTSGYLLCAGLWTLLLSAGA